MFFWGWGGRKAELGRREHELSPEPAAPGVESTWQAPRSDTWRGIRVIPEWAVRARFV